MSVDYIGCRCEGWTVFTTMLYTLFAFLRFLRSSAVTQGVSLLPSLFGSSPAVFGWLTSRLIRLPSSFPSSFFSFFF